MESASLLSTAPRKWVTSREVDLLCGCGEMRIGGGRWRDGDEQDADRHRVDGGGAGGVGAVVAGAEGTASHGGSGPNDPAVVAEDHNFGDTT